MRSSAELSLRITRATHGWVNLEPLQKRKPESIKHQLKVRMVSAILGQVIKENLDQQPNDAKQFLTPFLPANTDLSSILENQQPKDFLLKSFEKTLKTLWKQKENQALPDNINEIIYQIKRLSNEGIHPQRLVLFVTRHFSPPTA